MDQTGLPTLAQMRAHFYVAVVCDALDSLDRRHQSPRVEWQRFSTARTLVGRCKTTLWADMYHTDPDPYALELTAVDSCQPDDVLIVAAAGSLRSAAWGELLTTAAKSRGCIGAIVDGAVRDVSKLDALDFPLVARGLSPYDSRDRQRVIDIDVPVEIAGVTFAPGDLVFADRDGVVVVPRDVEEETIRRAWRKVQDENKVRQAILEGLTAREAFDRYGVL